MGEYFNIGIGSWILIAGGILLIIALLSALLHGEQKSCGIIDFIYRGNRLGISGIIFTLGILSLIVGGILCLLGD